MEPSMCSGYLGSSRLVAGLALLCSLAAQSVGATTRQEFQWGDAVLASPSETEDKWRKCLVVEGPDAGGNYGLNCESDVVGTELLVYVQARWIRPPPASGLRRPAAAPAFHPGEPVLASPPQVGLFWWHCEVRAPPTAARPHYALECEDGYWQDHRWVAFSRRGSAPPEWVKPDPPADAPAAAGGPGAVAKGRYECWAFVNGEGGPGFEVTGEGRYIDADGRAGDLRFEPATGRLEFRTGGMRHAMPPGYRAHYTEPGRRPTVRFLSPRQTVVVYCDGPEP
jgi:hypothetical protein